MASTRVLDEIDKIAEECKEPNWDGYDGAPISLRSRDLLKTVAQALTEFVDGDPCPCSDGSICLDWQKGDLDLSAAVYEENSSVLFMYLDKKNRWSIWASSDPLVIPDKFLEVLREHFKKEA